VEVDVVNVVVVVVVVVVTMVVVVWGAPTESLCRLHLHQPCHQGAQAYSVMT
jgi:hypothetical protein